MNLRRYVLLMLLISSLWACKHPPESPNPLPAELTPTRKVELLTTIENRFAALDWTNKSAAYQQLLTFLESLPEVEAAGMTDEKSNVWGRFRDGEMIVLANNRPFDPSLDTGDGRLAAPPLPTEPTGINLPKNTNIVMMTAMGTYYESGRDKLQKLETVVRNQGYQVTNRTGTLDQLRQVKDAGVFYFCTHGGEITGTNGQSQGVLWTADPANDETAVGRNMADLRSGRLCYITCFNDVNRAGRPVAATHFGITNKFVEKYMSFSQNALLYIDACYSFADQAMTDAFLQKTGHTGLYFGWTDEVGDQYAETASHYFFDRTLGTNNGDIRPERPNQRPFDPKAVYEDMVGKGLATYRYRKNNNLITTRLAFQGSANYYTFLRPTISFMDVDEVGRELNIVGFFGDDPGQGKRSVTVQGVEMNVLIWSVGLIVCKIPTTGPGSAGDVLVSVGTVASNVRRLTEWRGTLHYRDHRDGSLFKDFELDVHLRADVAKFRQDPGQTPAPNYQAPHIFSGGTFARDSDLYYSVGGSGTASSEGCTNSEDREYTRGTLAWSDPSEYQSTADHFQASIEQTFQGFTCSLDIWKEKAYYTVKTVRCPKSTSRNVYPDINITGVPIREFTLVLDAEGNIKAGKLEKRVEGSLLYDGPETVPHFTVTLEWDQMKAAYPPLSTASLRVGTNERNR